MRKDMLKKVAALALATTLIVPMNIGKLNVNTANAAQENVFTRSSKVQKIFKADFDTDEDLNKLTDGPGGFSIDTTNPKTGGGCLKAEFTGAWNQLGIGTFELKAGVEYTISFNWKIENYTNVNGDLNAYSRFAKSTDIYANLGRSEFQTTETDWTKVTYKCTPEEDVVSKIAFEVGGGTATMYIDDLVVSYVEQNDDDEIKNAVAYQDFENESDYTGKWRNQSISLGTMEFVEDPEDNSNHVLKYSVSELTSGAATFDFHNGDVQIFEQGKTYILSYKYKSTAAFHAYHACIDSGWNIYAEWVSTSSEWTTKTVEFVPNEKLSTFQIGFQLLENGVLYLDDLAIVKKEEPTSKPEETTTTKKEETTTTKKEETTTTTKQQVTTTTTVKPTTTTLGSTKISGKPSKKLSAKKVKVSFKKVKKAKKYTVQFATAKNFKKVLCSKTVKSTTVTISNKKLKNKKKLYVRVKAVGAKKWSKVVQIKVKK